MNRISLLSLLLVLYCFTTHAQTVYPYLQGATPVSMYVTWKTSSSTQSLVEWGTAPGVLPNSTNGTNSIWSDTGYPANYYYHSVQLTGLTPNTRYYYKVTSGTFQSAEHSFRTPPAAGNAMTPGGHIRFLILGDNQLKAPRFDTLMVQAKRQCEQRYGLPIHDQIAGILMVGDQVDVGTLDHYEFVHFDKSKYLSPQLPISTIVGNHETYGSLGTSAYDNHFFYQHYTYQGIASGSERFYAQQFGPVLVLNLNTEDASGAGATAQFTWLQSVMTAANADPTVKFVVSLAHRPYQAEQYVGDISPWIRNTVVPYLKNSAKYCLHVGAHHHLYARGQLRDAPVYHVISGGTAWDQYWGMGTDSDMEDVQKTISNWAYQVVDFDVTNSKMDVETYSCGSIYGYHNNRLIDHFHRYLGQAAPAKPAISAVPAAVTLPLTLSGSAFSSPAAELLNSTQFQVSQSLSFAPLERDVYRDFENLFGSAGSPDSTTDLNLGVDISQYTLAANSLSNGQYYARVRYRDRNQVWSAWSDAVSFEVQGSSGAAAPVITLNKANYAVSETIQVTYDNGPGLVKDWIGIYKKGQTPGGPAATAWGYVSGGSGSSTYTLTTPGEYFAAFFTNDTYTEIAPRVKFYIGTVPVVSTSKTVYAEGESVTVNFSSAPGFTNDWIGIYKVGHTPGTGSGTNPSTKWTYVTGANGNRSFTGLAKGYYFANYFLNDQYGEPGERVFFQVGNQITTLFTDKSVYNLGEYITATWADGPGNPKDWLGVYNSGADPNITPLISYTYIDGAPNGNKPIPAAAMPATTGSYFLVLFTNDSYNEVSNRVSFSVTNPLAVEWLSFLAERTDASTVALSWSTASEVNNKGFVVEQKLEGDSLFHAAGWVDGNGNTAGASHYTTTVADGSTGRSWYRLRQQDTNGQETLSEIREVGDLTQLPHYNEVRLFPNPSNTGASALQSDYPITRVELLNPAGQLVFSSDNVNDQRYTLLHQSLPAGVYCLRVYSRKVYNLKMVVEK